MKTRSFPGLTRTLQSSRLLVGSITMVLGFSSAQAATYYWDNLAGAGFGTAGGTWSATTAGPTPGWTTDATGAAVPASVTTATTDSINFGTATVGLGAGTITVSGTVSAGNITFGAASGAITLTGGTITMAAAETIAVNNATDTINSILAGGATSLNKTGTGILNLGGINTYAGATTVSAGTLNLTGARTVTAGAFTVGVASGGAAALGISAGTFSTSGFTIGNTGGAGTVNQTGGAITLTAGNQLLVGNGAGSGTYNLSAGTLTLAASATRGVMLGVNNDTSGTFNLSGTGSLVGGAGTSLMIGRSDVPQTGTTSLFNQTGGTATAGILTMGAAAATTNTGTSSTLTLTGGTFTASTFTLLAASNGNTSTINIGGTSTVTLPNFPTVRGTSSTATLNFDGGTLKNSATGIFITGLTNAFIKVGGAKFDTGLNSTTISQNLLTDVSSLGGGLTKQGINTLTLSGANTYTGATTIAAGTLNLGSAESVNVSGPLGKQLANAAGTILMTGGTLQYSASNANDYSGRFSTAGSQTWNIDTNSQTVTFGTALQGASSTLTKSGAGTLTLSVANSYAGVTSITGGTLVAGNVAAFGTTSAINLTNGTTGGSLQLSTDTSVNAYAIGGSSGAGAGTIVSDRATAGAGITHVLGAAALGNNTYNFTKGTNVTSGTAAISLASLSLAAGTTGTVILNPTTADLLIPGAVNIGSGANAKTLQLNGTSTGSSISGAISNNLAVLTLTKAGTGTWTLSGPNTYTGNTTITGGTLNISGGYTGNTTTSTLALGTAAANTVVNVSSNMTLFNVTGANLTGSSTAYNQTAGTVNISATGVGSAGSYMANIGYGYFNLTGGTFKSNGSFSIGTNNAASNGVAYVGGTGFLDWSGSGNQTLGYASAASLTVGPGGSVSRGNSVNTTWLATNANSSGILNIAGGNVDLGTAGNVYVTNSASATSVTLNLAGGTLTMGKALAMNVGTTGTLYANYAGGTLKASANLTSPMNVLTSVSTIFGAITNNNNANTDFNTQIGSTSNFTGGLTIDTGAFNMTYGNALLGASGNGVAQSNITVTGGSGYIGAPLLQFTGGTLAANGSPASGYAVISGGVVTGIVITSPGEYTVDPAVTLTGGGGTGASVALSTLSANAADNGLTKIGNGTLTLTNTNTYAGATTISAGKLVVTGAISNSTTTLNTGTLTGSGTLNGVNVANAVGNIISNNDGVPGASLTVGALTFNGAATVNTFNNGTSAAIVSTSLATNAAGTVTINPTAASWANGTAYDLISYTGGSIGGAGFGQFALGTVSGLSTRQTANSLVNSGTAVTLTITGADTIWTGALSTEWSTNILSNPKNWTLSGGGGITDFVTADTVIFDDTATNKTVDISNGDVLPTSVSFTNTTGNDYILQGSNGITGSTALSKTGSGTLTINNTNSYTSGTSITAGTLALGHATDTLANAGAVTLNGATAVLSIGANSDTVGAVSLKNGASITGSTGVLTGSSYAVESGSISAILGGAGIALNKTTSGIVTLSGANTYTGTTTISAGTLQLSGVATPGAAGSSVAVSSGALLDLNGTNQSIKFIAGTGVGTVANNSGSGTSTLTLAGTATINGGFVTITDNTTTPGGKVAVIIQATTQGMSNSNTYSGGTTVNAGAYLYLTSASSLGAGTGPINLTTATTGVGTGSGLVVDSVTYANDITGAGYVHNNSNSGATVVTTTLTGNLTTSGSFIFRAGTGIVYNFAGNGTTSVLSGVIGSTTSAVNGAVATGSIIKSGTGTLTLSGASVYTGTTTISGGTLKLGAAGGATNTPLGTITAGTVVSGTGTLDLAGFTLGTAEALSLAGTGTSGSGALANSGASATYSGLVTLGGNASIVANGNISLSNVGTITGPTFGLTLDGTATGSSIASIIGTGAGGLTKTGSGTWTLTAANTYTGATTISGGTLQIGNGSTTGRLTATSAITNDGNLTINRSNAFSQATDLGAGVAITGTGSFTQAGAGTTTLTVANTYQGATSITGGTLSLTGSGAVNSSSGITINGSGAKFLQTSSVAGTSGITLTQGTLTGSGTVGDVNVGAGTGGIISNNNGVAGASLATGALTFNGAATLNLWSSSTSAPLIAGSISTNAAGLVTINPTAASWNNGSTYDLINYTGGTIGGAGFGQFVLGTVTGITNRQSTTFADSGSAITMTFIGDNPYWTGANGSNWNTADTNWKLVTAGTDTLFMATDDVLFNDSGTNTTIDINAANVAPASTTFNNTSAVAYTISSTGSFGIASGSLTKNNTGTVTLSTNNSYTGGTTLNAGILRATTSANALGAGSLTLAGGELQLANDTGLSFGRNTTVTGNAQITSDTLTSVAGVTQTLGTLSIGGQTLTIAKGSNATGTTSGVTFGATSLSGAATFSIGANSTLTLGAVNNGANTATLTGAGKFAQTGVWGNGAGGLTLDSNFSGTATLNQANTFTGATTINGGNLALNLVGAIPNSATNTVTVNNGGTLTFGAANMWGGYISTTAPLTPLVINSGGMVTNSGNFTTPLGSLTLNGGTLTNIGGSNVPLLGGYVFKGLVTVGGTSGSLITGTANNTLGSSTSITGTTFNVGVTGAATDLTVTTFLSNGFSAGSTAQASFLTKTGAGTMALSGANTYTGVTSVKQGGLVLFGGNNRIVSNGAVVLGDTGTTGKLVLGDATAASNQTLASLTATGLGGSVVGANATTNSILTLSFTSGTVTYAGTLGGAGTNENMLALNKTGAGTFALSGTNSYTGGTTISGGILTANSNGALGAGTVTFNGGVRLLLGDGVILANAIAIGANAVGSGNGLVQYNGGAAATVSGPITITSGAAGGGHFGSASTGVLNITGTITSSVPVTQRLGTVVYSGGGAGYTNFTINSGTAKLGANDGFATTATVDIAASTAASLDLAGFNQSLVGITKVTANAGTIGNSSTTNDSMLTTTGISSYAGTIVDVIGSGTQKVALTVNGGSLTLTGSNTYTGDTAISSGKLVVNGNQSLATGATTVAAGAVADTSVATLAGNGTLGGNVTLAAESAAGYKNGGVLAPTASANGTALDVTGTTTFGTGSIFEWNLVTADGTDPGANTSNFGSYGQLAGTGAITGSDAIFKVVLSGSTFASNFWDTSKTWTNVFSGAGATIALDTLFTSFDTSSGLSSTGIAAGRGQFTFNGSTSTLTWSAVPEPSTALVGLLIGAGLLRRRRSA